MVLVMSHPATAMRKLIFLLIPMAAGAVFLSGQKTRQMPDSGSPGASPGTSASLPNTIDVMPSRGVGPFDAKQAQEWRAAAETLSAQSRYGEAEKLYVKLLDERDLDAEIRGYAELLQEGKCPKA